MLSASAWAAGANDAKARRAGDEALDRHYLAMNMKQAEAELKAALELCDKQQCSPEVAATLHRDLATVYIAGMQQTGPGKQQMQRALELDPKLTLNPDLATDEVREAFVAAGGVEQDTPEPADAGGDIELEEIEEPELEAEPEADRAPGSGGVHWLSAGVQFDFMRHTAAAGVCNAADSDYFCYNQRDLRYGSEPGEGALSPAAGNQVHGGFAKGTTRLLLGYDHRVTDNVLLGGRVGFAFGGAPVSPGEQAFQAWHAEVRAQYLFLESPLSGSGFDPYAALQAGAAQVDSGVPVDVWLDADPPPAGTRYELRGYKKTGKAFVGLALGTYYSLSDKIAPFAELQYLQMLGVSAQVVAVRLGITYAL